MSWKGDRLYLRCRLLHVKEQCRLQTFDELVLLKRGGVIIYSGALGTNSSTMVSYFENIHGVPRIAEDFNPVRPASPLLLPPVYPNPSSRMP